MLMCICVKMSDQKVEVGLKVPQSQSIWYNDREILRELLMKILQQLNWGVEM